MKEGYWLNYKNGKFFEINEHEQWLRTPGNAKLLDVPSNIITSFSKFRPVTDRDKFLLFVLKNAPVIRVRGHGDYISFEYFSLERQTVMESMENLLKNIAGPVTQLYIVNFSTKESLQISYKQFEETMDKEGAEGLMRVGSVEKFIINIT